MNLTRLVMLIFLATFLVAARFQIKDMCTEFELESVTPDVASYLPIDEFSKVSHEDIYFGKHHYLAEFRFAKADRPESIATRPLVESLTELDLLAPLAMVNIRLWKPREEDSQEKIGFSVGQVQKGKERHLVIAYAFSNEVQPRTHRVGDNHYGFMEYFLQVAFYALTKHIEIGAVHSVALMQIEHLSTNLQLLREDLDARRDTEARLPPSNFDRAALSRGFARTVFHRTVARLFERLGLEVFDPHLVGGSYRSLEKAGFSWRPGRNQRIQDFIDKLDPDYRSAPEKFLFTGYNVRYRVR